MSPALQRRVFARSLFLQSCWNYEGMQNVGFAYAVDPCLKECYGDGPRLTRARLRHLEFFNTQPYMAGIILGLVCALEGEAALTPEDDAKIARIGALKRGAAGALAGIGDALFWATLRPFCAAAAILLAAALRWKIQPPAAIVAGMAAYIILFNAPALCLRWKGLSWGFDCKEQIALKLKGFPWQAWIARLRLAGLVLIAAAAAPYFAQFARRPLVEPIAFVAAVAAKIFSVRSARLYFAAAALGAAASFLGWL